MVKKDGELEWKNERYIETGGAECIVGSSIEMLCGKILFWEYFACRVYLYIGTGTVWEGSCEQEIEVREFLNAFNILSSW